MAFASIHIPDFILQAALRAHPECRKSPVAILEGNPPLERIIAANPSAVSLGLQIGMPRAQAEELYEDAVLLLRSPGLEQAAHAALLDLGWSCSPRLEDAAADTILLDLSGLAELFGPDQQIAERLIRGAAHFDLQAHVAVAANLDAAFYASRGYPGITLIPAGEEADRLGDLPVQVLSPAHRDTEPDAMEILERWGIRTCAALAALPLLELSERLGPAGVRLHELARGGVARSMILAEPPASFEEAMELDDAVAEIEPLLFILGRLLDQLCARLQARALSASAIHVRFDLQPAVDRPESSAAKNANAAETVSGAFEKTMLLPVPMRDSKLLLTLLRLQLESNPPPRAILKVTLSATPAPPRGTQSGLFLPAYPQPEKLELTMARLAHLVGPGNVGRPQIVDTHRPGEFRMGGFSVAGISAARRSRKAAKASEPEPGGALPTALRSFRPPIPASVVLSEGRPAQISFRGQRGEVLAASGPWRTSGAWWEPGAWQCDEWDVEVLFPPGPKPALPPASLHLPISEEASTPERPRGVYRIFFDALRQAWFVRGAYD